MAAGTEGTAKRRVSGVRPRLSVRARIVGGFTILCVIFAAAVSVSAWQERIHRNDLQELDRHSSTATLLQEAEAQAGMAALLLQRYVMAGDDSHVPEIQKHAGGAVDSLTAAIAMGTLPGVDDIAIQGAGLTTGAGHVMALRQTGQTEAAAAAMEEIVPVFREFRLALEDATEVELQRVSDLRSSADQAGNLAFLLLILTGAIGVATALAISATIARSIINPLSSLEATAATASGGDLSVRADVTGPRELAKLGTVLNEMMAAVESHTSELSEAYEELKERNRQLTDARVQAATDPLTGLGNHRAFHRRLRDETGNSEVSGSSVSLVLFDIDGFKGVNDSLGHLAGDEILRRLASALGNVVEPSDSYRYGGDEFAILLVGSGRNEAMRAAENVRSTIEEMPQEHGQMLTVSLGVATFPDMAASAEELIYRADMAMYWAKSTGKNRVGDWDGLLSRRAEGPLPRYLEAGAGRSPDVIASLISALAAKDPLTRDHTERCAWYAAELAEEMGLGEEDTAVLRLASLLHDVGKLVMPDNVLRKPGPLAEDEWAIMRQHPTYAAHILSQVPAVSQAVPAILHHHEHFDGSGYPHGLVGENIPLTSRILMVTDAFDAMTTDRPYRKAMPIEAALDELRRHSGTQFDPKVVEAFVNLITRNGAHPLRTSAATGERGASS